jgi:hypothetical protein
MEQQIRQGILLVLKEALEILNSPRPNSSDLKDISNHIIHNASIYQDEDSVSTAVLIYSLSKTVEYISSSQDYVKVRNLFMDSIYYLEKGDIPTYQECIKKVFSIISRIDSKFRAYVQEVIKQASIKKGGRIYEHGISASKTAEILGLSLWEFYRYIGAINVADTTAEISNVRERLKYARKLFE